MGPHRPWSRDQLARLWCRLGRCRRFAGPRAAADFDGLEFKSHVVNNLSDGFTSEEPKLRFNSTALHPEPQRQNAQDADVCFSDMATVRPEPVKEAAKMATGPMKRARELYRYLQPDNLVQPHLIRRPSTVEAYSEKVPNLSAALTPFCQLTALRLNTRKAMLNVMDRDVMYFLAEACRVPTADGSSEPYDFIEDPILMACSSVPLEGRICELTLCLTKSVDIEVPIFAINDLSKSSFKHLGPVAGPPYYRFYAGTPIMTSNGINIGSLAVMDVEPRDGLTPSEVEFLGKTASQIMTYLETNRQAIDGRRARRLAEGLQDFIAGKNSMHDLHLNKVARQSSRKKKVYGVQTPPRSAGVNGSVPASPIHPSKSSPMKARASLESLTSETGTSEMTSETDDLPAKGSESESRSHENTFARAANLLREAFGNLGDDGMVAFLATKGRLDKHSRPSVTDVARMQSANSVATQTTSIGADTSDQFAGQPGSNAKVLAASTMVSPLAQAGTVAAPEINLNDATLRDLMQRYPGGRLWSLEDPNRLSSSEDEIRQRPGSEAVGRSTRRKRAEQEALSAAFPHARQVLFAPVWDPSSGSFRQAVFVVAASDTRSLGAMTELSFLHSYCSTVMAECSRIDAIKSEQTQSDFVGTISHEMRSPLHGILASTEFLADTDLSSFQESLVDTIESCGRTLLDTINHVLDFSKVNSFQKHWEASNKRTTHMNRRRHYLGPDNSSKTVTTNAPPLLQLFAVTDISAVLEEVVDGLVVGQTFNSGVDITDTSRQARGKGQSNSQNADLPHEDVQVILDVQQANWSFLTQPGAIRRVILNICGNAMKYTTHGSIAIRLELRPGEAPDDDLMLFRVTDTGRGISADFLRNKLFIAFAQENSLAPGTGLGMSIVSSIVTMLGGTIDVKSQVGKGTTVEVALPLKRPLPGQASTVNTPHSGNTTSSSGSRPDESLQLLQTQAADSRVAYHRPQRTLDNDKLDEILCRYVRGWYGLEYVDPRLTASANVVITEEEDLESLMLKVIGTPGQRPALVVLCSVASRHSASYINALESRINGAVSFVAKPLGPYKLSKAIRLALEKLKTIRPQIKEVSSLEVIPEQGSSETTPLNFADSDEAVATTLQEMDLSANNDNPGQVVQASETIAISQMSEHAQMAMRSPNASTRTPALQQKESGSFPFPNQSDESLDQPNAQTGQSQQEVSTMARKRTLSIPQAAITTNPAVNPRILLVDDNLINLRLLKTFLTNKRKYTRIDMAEDGQQAVDVFTMNSSLGDGFEIIFMDISMPVMNGFEATRAIREYEEQNSAHVGKGTMVIALTGLASGRDQAEGFDAGVDIYLTKPVSFKEVGKLLDNWEAHKLVKEEGDVPPSLQGGKTMAKVENIKDAINPAAEAGSLGRERVVQFDG